LPAPDRTEAPFPIENWQVRKPPVRSSRGVVAAQNRHAAEVGASVLRNGGNAVDAAVATGFALSVVEPWMSGLGGGGYMMIYKADERRVHAIDFSMIAPMDLDPSAYPLSGGTQDDDLFGWPAVKESRNVLGPLSIAAPGSVDGFGLALQTFGTLSWADAIAPSIELARRGLPVDWWTTLRVAWEAPALNAFDQARATYLPNGLPPTPGNSPTTYLRLGALSDTLQRLATKGPREFYEGEIAETLIRDVQAAGGVLTKTDLESYKAQPIDTSAIARNGAEIHLLKGLNAGPTFQRALGELPAIPRGKPGTAAYLGYAESLSLAYTERLAIMGHDGDTAGQASTTHFSVADAAGNLVACTNTLLSLFGSKIISPDTGVLLNNGVMWFDPRPGRPNSIAPGQRPLSNMCPAIVTRDSAPWFALGASGGRRILPAVYQMVSFLVDCGLSLEEAIHHPRVNVDGSGRVQIDRRLPKDVVAAISGPLEADVVEALLVPNYFANPVIALRDGEDCMGAAQIPSPVAAAVGA